MDDPAPRSKRSPLTGAVLVCGFGLLLYLLSVGPIIALADRGVFNGWEETIILGYIPIIWLHEHVPAARPPIDGWIELWRNLL